MDESANLHTCDLSAPHDGYGPAVEYCYEDSDGKLWVGNGEYGSQVNFCPVCGFAAKKKEENPKEPVNG
jgi:hypothetical protein